MQWEMKLQKLFFGKRNLHGVSWSDFETLQ